MHQTRYKRITIPPELIVVHINFPYQRVMGWGLYSFSKQLVEKGCLYCMHIFTNLKTRAFVTWLQIILVNIKSEHVGIFVSSARQRRCLPRGPGA